MDDLPVAVVGPRGFLGTYVIRHLKSRGLPVMPIQRSEELASDEIDSLCQTRAILWCAGSSTPHTASEDPSSTGAELLSFRRFVSLLPDTTQPRLVLASSGGTAYATDIEPPYSESAPTDRGSAYARLKLDMEASLPTDGVAVRLSNIYGAGQKPRRGLGVVAHWLHAAANGSALRLFGSDQSARDYLHASDAAEAMISLALAEGPVPSVVNAGSGHATTLSELLEIIRRTTSPLEIAVERVLTPRGFDRQETWLDIQLIEKTTGWLPAVGLEEGVAQAWRQIRSDIDGEP